MHWTATATATPSLAAAIRSQSQGLDAPAGWRIAGSPLTEVSLKRREGPPDSPLQRIPAPLCFLSSMLQSFRLSSAL